MHGHSVKNCGDAPYNKKDYDRAIADYNEALRVDPQFPIGYVVRSNAWYAKKDYDRAIADYNEAIRLDPQYPLAYFYRGNARAWQRDYDSATPGAARAFLHETHRQSLRT